MAEQKRHILLAEDDEDDVVFFREAVQALSLPFELTVVNNGEHALNYISESSTLPDFVFLDINMPKLNGIETLKAIRALHPSHDIHVIMLSTSLSEIMVEQSYRFGASLYIQKPTRFADLKHYVSYCLTHLQEKAVQEHFVLNRYFAALAR